MPDQDLVIDNVKIIQIENISTLVQHWELFSQEDSKSVDYCKNNLGSDCSSNDPG